MSGNFLLVARQVAILFVLMGVGVVCRRARLVDEFSVRGVVNVLLHVVTPAIVIDCFQRQFDPSMLRQLALAFVIASAAHVVQIAVASLLLRGEVRTSSVLRLSAVFSNAGFMGLPLEYAVLGPNGVFYGIVYVAVFNLFVWSWGLRTMSGSGLNWRPMLLNPGTVGLAVGLPLFLFSAHLPEIIGRPLHALAEMNTPLAMLVIGYYLAGADMRGVLRLPAAHHAAFLRLVAFPMVLIGVLFLFKSRLDRTMTLAMVTAASAPVAAMVTMFASKWSRDVDLSVGLVSSTTLLSVASMPAVLAIAMAVL